MLLYGTLSHYRIHLAFYMVLLYCSYIIIGIQYNTVQYMVLLELWHCYSSYSTLLLYGTPLRLYDNPYIGGTLSYTISVIYGTLSLRFAFHMVYSGYTVILLYGILTLTLSFCMVLWLYHNHSIWYSDYTLAFYILQSTWCSGYTVGARVVPLESYPLSQLFKPVCFPLGVTKFTFKKSPPPFIFYPSGQWTPQQRNKILIRLFFWKRFRWLASTKEFQNNLNI